MSALDQQDLQTAVHAALVDWGKPTEKGLEYLARLLLLQNQIQLPQNKTTLEMRHAVDHLLLDNIAKLATQDEAAATLLEHRFIEGKITRQVAQEMHASPDQVNRWQRAAITHLTQLIYDQELALRAGVAQRMEAALPPLPYTQFFGFREAQQKIKSRLMQTTHPWLIAIAGIGGIGKTSLTDVVVRDLLPTGQYQQLCWVRVNTQQLSGLHLSPEAAYEQLLTDISHGLWPDRPQSEPKPILENRIRQTLKAAPHLIVIDNLESAAHLTYFCEQLTTFTNPSRFLLTSRVRPPGNTAVYTYSLHELPFDDAAALLRHHAELIGLDALAEADHKTIKDIYEVTGGNPLALKLVASLTAVLPLPQILTDLNQNRAGPIEDLYRHIYWETWRTLSAASQQLLQAMPLVAATGVLPEQMRAMSGLDEDAFWTAVHELTARSLLQVQGTIQERRYGIHRLTETFLHTEIIHLPQLSDT